MTYLLSDEYHAYLQRATQLHKAGAEDEDEDVNSILSMFREIAAPITAEVRPKITLDPLY